MCRCRCSLSLIVASSLPFIHAGCLSRAFPGSRSPPTAGVTSPPVET